MLSGLFVRFFGPLHPFFFFFHSLVAAASPRIRQINGSSFTRFVEFFFFGKCVSLSTGVRGNWPQYLSHFIGSLPYTCTLNSFLNTLKLPGIFNFLSMYLPSVLTNFAPLYIFVRSSNEVQARRKWTL